MRQYVVAVLFQIRTRDFWHESVQRIFLPSGTSYLSANNTVLSLLNAYRSPARAKILDLDTREVLWELVPLDYFSPFRIELQHPYHGEIYRIEVTYLALDREFLFARTYYREQYGDIFTFLPQVVNTFHTVVRVRFFPELWDLREFLTDDSETSSETVEDGF
jgi:hypothetical protein